MKKMLEWDVSVKSTEEVLCSDSVSRFIVDCWDEFVGAVEKSFENAYFGDGIVWATRVTTDASSCARGCEVDDCVSEEGDVGEKVSLFLRLRWP